MDTSLNIVELIENNPITKLTGSYQNKLVTKIKEKFNDNEQQMFVASFYCYLKYDRKNDFVIDLDDVWKWLSFSNKAHAKTVLTKNFVINKDYVLLLTKKGEQKEHTRGGHNKEIIMLNINTFKKICLKAGTKKADEIHEYYIKLEETLQEVLEEESNELKLQLEEKEVEIKKIEIDKDKIREKTLLEQFPNNVQCVYYGRIDNMSDKKEQLIKFGNSNHLKNRVTKHKDTYLNFRLINAFKVENKLQIENALKENPVFMERQRNLSLKGKKYVELLNTDDLSFAEIDKIIKDIIINIEYSRENYKKILEENKQLRKQLDEKNEKNSSHQVILLETENKRLKGENIKLLKKYGGLLKKIVQDDEFNAKLNLIQDVKEEDEVTVKDDEIENYEKMININTLNKKNKDGKYTIHGKTYDKLCGSRDEVWNDIAYKTRGNLLKCDFMINKSGKIISKKKCIQETINNRFEKYGVNILKEESSK